VTQQKQTIAHVPMCYCIMLRLQGGKGNEDCVAPSPKIGAQRSKKQTSPVVSVLLS
jgi:hypothetical protein